MIGDSRNGARNRPTSLPAEARSLSRMLRLLKSPETASTALLETLTTLPPPSDPGQRAALERIREQVPLSINTMKKDGWDSISNRYAEYNMSMAVEVLLRDAASFLTPKQTSPDKRSSLASPSTGSSASDGTSNIIPTNKARSNNNLMGASCGSVSSLESPAPKTTQIPNSARRGAVVSDYSSVEDDSVTATAPPAGETRVEEEEAGVDDELKVAKSARDLWAIILESVHLQVASRTTTVWGRKKIYEIYQLARPVRDFAAEEQPSIRQRLEVESRSVFDGILLDSGYCRLYTTLQPLAGFDRNIEALHVQINLGKIFDLQDESNRSSSGEKKKKDGGEFVAILVPGSSLFALTASRSASRSRYTPYVLALLENALTETTNNCAAMKAKKNAGFEDIAAKRFEDLSGTEPHELLRAARAVAVGGAVGRYAFMASKDQSNPVNDLRKAVAGNLLCAIDPAEGKEVGSGRLGDSKVAQIAKQVDVESNGAASLVAATRGGQNLWVDHSSKQKESRKRSREEALGRNKDCPKLQRVCWKWEGETTAASACWLEDGLDEATEAKILEGLPKTRFKCAVTMKGENVFQGIQALVDAGLMKAPVPDFIREAPSLGGTIRVKNGCFAGADTTFSDEEG